MTRKRLLRDLRLDWRGAVIAVSCAVLYAVFLRYREEVWRHTFQSTMYLAFWVLLKLQGAALLVVNNDGLPVFGNRDVRLLVTPFCAGNEAIIMFWLWWSALWSKPGFDRRCAEIWFHRLLAGTFLLWIVNVLRFDGLIWLGQWHGVQLAVRMAHSQLWFIIALCLSAMILRNPPLIDAESTKTTPHQMQGEGL